MSRWEAWTTHAAMLLVAGTGLVYAWMLYLLRPSDPYAVVHHPLQPLVQHLHVLTAPLLVFAIGAIWGEHVWAHWRRGVARRRRTGLVLLAGLVPMGMSGYLLQTAVDERWRHVWVVVHLVASGLFVLGYLGHSVSALVAWQRQRRRAAALPPEIAGRARAAR
jgi:hypothetical protein